MYVEIFVVDLISRVHASTATLKTLFSNPHTSTSPITGDQHVDIHVVYMYVLGNL